MLSLFQKLFGKSRARKQAPQSAPQVQPTPHLSTVEVAHLRLATILERLPDELKPLVLKAPEDSATVALPMATILKQLPGGSVRMSLATLHRQAPDGVLAMLPSGDKRMVDVPLAEIFRHVSPMALKRRSDQRMTEACDSDFNLFGDAENPYHIAPTAPAEELEVAGTREAEELAAVDPGSADGIEAEIFKPAFKIAPAPAPAAPRVIAPPSDFFGAKPAKAAAPAPPAKTGADLHQTIEVPLEPLSGGWPEPIRHALAALNGAARVKLPAAEVTAGLARGRVAFTWGQLRAWIEPAPGPIAHDDATELTLPLKVVAPVFLAATKNAKSAPKPAAFATDIPTLFNDTRASVPPAPELRLEAPAEPAPAPAAPAMPTTMSELFGEPARTEWTPAEVVANVARLRGVAGAAIALQEGLLVAHSLPAEVKGDVIAAFLPQIFSRLNQYSSEMKLGEVDDLLFTTHGAHCQIYRLGFIYFAVLGQPGEPLPAAELRLVAAELGRQTQKS